MTAKVSAKTATPFLISFDEENSSGRWLYPLKHGMKIIAVGQIRAMNSES